MGGKTIPTVITDARSGTSEEMATRQKRYAITMAFRTACFVSMVFVPGNFRWILFAGAVLLPYVAVVFANQVDTRSPATSAIATGEAASAPQLTVGAPVETVKGEVLPDDVSEDHRDTRDRVA